MKLRTKAQEQHQGRRLDLFLAFVFPEHSRSYFKRMIVTDRVKVNDEVQFRPQYKINLGDEVEVDAEVAPEEHKIKAVPLKLDIVTENNDYLVINKPSGLVVHPGSGHWDDTLANGIKSYLGDEDLFGDDRAGLVHRLDKPTSGIIIIAKTPQALWNLSRQFAERRVSKTYLCIVKGKVESHFMVMNQIGRDRNNRQKFSSRTNQGKRAETSFNLLATSEDEKYSLVAAYPKTGRTHQIRVHLSESGYPIVGDIKYGGGKDYRLLLHAYNLRIQVEDDNSAADGNSVVQEFTAPLPKDFKEAALALGFSPAILKQYVS
jgi:23S rRNA pseudouridine1911/1915/1917 synthase